MSLTLTIHSRKLVESDLKIYINSEKWSCNCRNWRKSSKWPRTT